MDSARRRDAATEVAERQVTSADLQLSGMRTLEHVAVTVTISHPRRGNLEIRLFCPSGISSLIGAPRSMDTDPSGFSDWTFSSVRCWGEIAEGTYMVEASDIGDDSLQQGLLQHWQLTLYGSAWGLEDVAERRRFVEEAQSGDYLNSNFSLPCPPGLEISEQEIYVISNNMLRTLMLLGCFAVFWSVYYTLETFLSRMSDNGDLEMNFEVPCCGRTYAQGDHCPRQLQTGSETLPLCGIKDGAFDEEETLDTHQHMEINIEQSSNCAGHGHLLTSDIWSCSDTKAQDEQNTVLCDVGPEYK